MKRLSYSLVLISLSLSISVPHQSAWAQAMLLDNFEGSSRRIVQPNEKTDLKYLWNLYTAPGTGTAFSTAVKHDGKQSLCSAFTGVTDWQFQFYTYTDLLPGWSNGWKYIRRFVNNPNMTYPGGSPAWQMGTINRMRFWIKVPPNIVLNVPGRYTFNVGTFLTNNESLGESDNHHHYHLYNIGYTGQWEQVIVDTHPDFIRNDNGDTERPDLLFPYNDGNTYFDLMTRFYLAFEFGTAGTYCFDGFELYQDSNPENVDQVRSLHAVHIPGTNVVSVGWTRRKDQATVNHEVRYAFSDIFSIGFANATVAPNGTITPPASGGFNTMSWSTASLNLSGRSVLYVAIKPQNSTSFRQISIPLTPGATLSPPANLRIVP